MFLVPSVYQIDYFKSTMTQTERLSLYSSNKHCVIAQKLGGVVAVNITTVNLKKWRVYIACCPEFFYEVRPPLGPEDCDRVGWV